MKRTKKKPPPPLNLNLHATQFWALYCSAQEVLFGGAAGGGKSYLMRVAAIMWAMAVPGLQLFLFRRSYKDLQRSHMEGAMNFHVLLGPLLESGHCTIVEHQIRFWNGSKINLCHLQHKKDLDSYQSVEFHVLLIDESTHFTAEEYQFLRGRCRVSESVQANIPKDCKWEFPRVLCGTNPGGKGHHYFKDNFVDYDGYVVHEAPEDDGGMMRCFIPSRLEDNPAMTKADPDYRKRLSGIGDPLIVKAMRDGDWNVVAGAMFADKWRTARHVIDPFAIPWDWTIWRGGDDGYAAPASVTWLTRDPFSDTLYVIAELYAKHMTAEVFAKRTLLIDNSIPRIGPEGVIYTNTDELTGAMDSASWANTGQAKKSRGRQMTDAGAHWKKTKKDRGARVLDVQNFQGLLDPNPDDPQKRPRIMFFKNCRNHIKGIPAIMRDDDNPEDVDTDDDFDHVWDSTRYGISYRGRRSGLIRRTG